jgi:diacylglycerol kinase (ATP)
VSSGWLRLTNRRQNQNRELDPRVPPYTWQYKSFRNFKMETPYPFLFIINPNSGTSIGLSPEKVGNTIKEFVEDHGLQADVVFTKHRGHAAELVAKRRDEHWRAIVAVGGDGTVNEIAKGLVSTNLSLGILPLGSGNGLARHLKLPLTLLGSLEKLIAGSPIIIDTATLNGIPFFCTAGVGFDAHVGYLFSQQATRGLSSYVSVSLKSFWGYQPQRYKVNGIDMEVFSLSIANAGQYGNNAWIAPQASLQDGLLDLCAIKPFPWWYGIRLAYRMFNKSLAPSPYIDYQTVRNIVIESERPAIMHYDGEPIQLDTTRIEIRINPASLKVIV